MDAIDDVLWRYESPPLPALRPSRLRRRAPDGVDGDSPARDARIYLLDIPFPRQHMVGRRLRPVLQPP